MKLIIKRNQADKKGLFGGNKGVDFTLSYKVELTPEEQELINKYKVQNEVLMTSHDGYLKTTIQDLINGQAQTTQDIETLLKNEGVAKNVCKNFKNYLDVLRSFGGEEVVEY